MSGGSMDYFCFKVENCAEMHLLEHSHPLRQALGRHMVKLAEVLHDIEWSDSGDYDSDSWIAPTEKFLQERTKLLKTRVRISDPESGDVFDEFDHWVEVP